MDELTSFNICQYKKAKLIPVLADSKKEEKATSILLASLSVIPDLAKSLLGEIGANITQRSKISVYTEVVFKGEENKYRPDGLIVIKNGANIWSALVESKVGNNDLNLDQIEHYLDLAKKYSINTVLTLSNQYVADPSHHPVKVNKNKTRTVSLVHNSWMTIITACFLLSDNKKVSDPEQSFILEELLEYLSDSSSGVVSAFKLSSDWRDTCEKVLNGEVIKKSDPSIASSVNDWHQFQRHLSIKLTTALSKKTETNINRSHMKDPAARINADVDKLIKTSVYECSLKIPATAGLLNIIFDVSKRTLTFSMELVAPKDVKRQSASINWLGRQLRSCDLRTNDLVFVSWPRRSQKTSIYAVYIEEQGDALLMPEIKDIPSGFSIMRIIDLGAKIKAVNSLVEIAELELISFYENIGQNLSAWQPKPPKVKELVQD